MQSDLEAQRAFFASRAPVAAKVTKQTNNAQGAAVSATTAATATPPANAASAARIALPAGTTEFRARPPMRQATAGRQQKQQEQRQRQQPFGNVSAKAAATASSAAADGRAPFNPVGIMGGIVERTPTRSASAAVAQKFPLPMGCTTGFPSATAFEAARRRKREQKLRQQPQQQRSTNLKPKSAFMRRREAAKQQRAHRGSQQVGSLSSTRQAVLGSGEGGGSGSSGDGGGGDGGGGRLVERETPAKIDVPLGVAPVALSSSANNTNNRASAESARFAAPGAPVGPMFAHEEDGQRIHQDAMAMLHAMSDEEKLAAQRELLATLSPEVRQERVTGRVIPRWMDCLPFLNDSFAEHSTAPPAEQSNPVSLRPFFRRVCTHLYRREMRTAPSVVNHSPLVVWRVRTVVRMIRLPTAVRRGVVKWCVCVCACVRVRARARVVSPARSLHCCETPTPTAGRKPKRKLTLWRIW